jgi:hypothetical protein
MIDLMSVNFTNKPGPATRVFAFLWLSFAAFDIFGCKTANPPAIATELPSMDSETVEETPPFGEYPEEGVESNYAAEDLSEYTDDLPSSSFQEVWAYLLNGQEKKLNPRYPISDLVHFAAEVDRYGHLSGIPRRKAITRFAGRVHLAIVCGSAGLTHFVIQSGSEARKQLVSEILASVKDYDGLNVDMEYVPALDMEHFSSFLSELRDGLGDRELSVCVPSRTRAGGPYNYATMAELADRVFVMAYDEHWSGGPPGPVASMNWCKSVADYSLHTVGQKKLVMGIPFYGRAWGDKRTSGALIHSTVESYRQEYGAQDFHRVNGIPTFTYDVTVKVTVYYEDEYSLAARMLMYRSQGVQNIGFWCLGQEAAGVWRLINLDG